MADAREPEEDWYLQDWLRHFGKKQTSLVQELGWSKNRANLFFHSQQPYRREVVNEIAKWLNIKPFELLMAPQEALSMRRLREVAHAIVADTTKGFDGPPTNPKKR